MTATDGKRSTRSIRARDAGAARTASARTAIGCSSSRPTPPSRPNTCCCGIISASRSTPRSKRKIAVYLRRIQGAAWRLAAVPDGDFDVSASVKAYFALKMIGDAIDAAHMRRAREAILARGGAARANVFTRIMLALFGFIPWRAVPVMPVEIMLLPKWFPFHLDKISYWSRTVIVPLLVLMAQKPQARNPKACASTSCFSNRRRRSARRRRRRSRKRRGSGSSAASTTCCAPREPYFPKAHAAARDRPRRRLGERAAQRRGRARRDLSGHGQQRDDVRRARLSGRSSAARHRPRSRSRSFWSCTSTRPIASPASRRSGTPASSATRCWKSAARRAVAQAKRGLDWLAPKQVLDVRGDWIARRPDLRPGGWAFQYANSALSRCRRHRGRRHGDGSRAEPVGPPGFRRDARARAGMDRRHAERERRLGRVRRRQRILLSQQHSVRRPRRAARSADRGRHRALPVDAGAARRDRGEQPGGRARHRLSARARSSPTAAGTAAGA